MNSMKLDQKILRDFHYFETFEIKDEYYTNFIAEFGRGIWLLVIGMKYGGISDYIKNRYSIIDAKVKSNCQKELDKGFSKDDLELRKLQYDELNTLFKFFYQKTLKSETISDEKRLERIIESMIYTSAHNDNNAGLFIYTRRFIKNLPDTLYLMYFISAAHNQENEKKVVLPTLRKEFGKFIKNLSKTSFYDENTKTFDLSTFKNTTPLQSLQYLLVVFRENLDKRLEVKTPNTSLYKLFNKHFENHKNMTSQNWNHFKDNNLDERNNNDFYIALKQEL